jgi:hypothetical protein
LEGEEPDGTSIALDLSGHRPRVAILDTIKTEHHCHVGSQGFPELRFQLFISGNRTASKE